MSLPVVYHPDYMAPLRAGHRFPMSKYGYLRDHLVRDGLLPETGGYIAPAPASLAQIAAAHGWDYADRAFRLCLTEREVREIGLPQNERVVRRARLSSAGTTLAARLALEHGIAVNLAGGSHHAGPQRGAGFCVFNDVAVAARALLDEGHVSRILVVDCDVHQGDGTAAIFANDPAVFTLSLHAEKNYPVRKQASDLDFGLPDGLHDAPYLEVLREVLTPLWDQVRPDLVFYNAGVDPHQDDRLGRLSLTDAGLAVRDDYVLRSAVARGIPVVGVIGGGYGPEPAEIAARHALMVASAARNVSA